MRFLLACSLVAISSLTSLTSAWPLIRNSNNNIERRQRVSYSVVAVDGGDSTTATVPAATVTLDAQTLTTTQVITTVTTVSGQPTTIIITVTSATTITAPPSSRTASPATVTVTATPSTAVTKPYDDGMWHTTYYYTVPNPTSTSSPSTISATSSSIPSSSSISAIQTSNSTTASTTNSTTSSGSTSSVVTLPTPITPAHAHWIDWNSTSGHGNETVSWMRWSHNNRES